MSSSLMKRRCITTESIPAPRGKNAAKKNVRFSLSMNHVRVASLSNEGDSRHEGISNVAALS